MNQNTTAGAVLWDLHAEELIDSLLDGDNPIHEHIAFTDPRQLQQLSPYLWKELKRLRDFEKAHKHCGQRYFPHADKALFSYDGTRIREEEAENSGTVSGYGHRNRFRDEWGYSATDFWQAGLPAAIGNNGRKEMIYWDSRVLYRKDCKSGFEVCTCDDGYAKSHCTTHPPRKCRGFYDWISSPLLYYRLATIFGMPPRVPMGDKSCWGATLCNFRHEGSYLYLSEQKGGAEVFFRGSLAASESALRFLDWLVSDDVPHPYDGVLAGSIA